MESFLNEGEIPNYASVLKHNAGPDSDPVLVSIHGVFAWESRQAEHSDVSLPQDASQQPNDSPKTDEERRGNTGFELNLPGPIIFPVGLTIICGATASGKSSFLQALLGEMPCVEGKGPHLIKDMANVAYGAQSAWIETGTVKENILFGSKFDQARYDAVLEATCLKPDIALFDGGDQVEVGERGTLHTLIDLPPNL